MSVAILARNETLKTVKRPASIVTTALLAGLLGLMSYSMIRQHARHPERGPFALPVAWGEILHEAAVPTAFFAAILIILLVASEFSWRTARQNVIDGLSKDQWFGGKLLLYVMVVLAFLALQLLLGGSFALVSGGVKGAFVRVTDLRLAGASLLLLAGIGSMGLFAAFLARSAGPAMAIFFFYLAILEQLLGAGLGRLGGVWATVAGYLPMKLFSSIVEPARYDPAAYERMVATLTKANRPIPTFDDTRLLVMVGIGETVLFLVAAYGLYRRRDL